MTFRPCYFRFSQFFISPTFDEDSTSREVEAVNSENEKNIMTDVRRSYQIDKATCNQNHDYSKFSTGNRVLNFYAVFFFKHDKNALEPQKTFENK